MKRKKAGRTPSPEGRVTIKLSVPPYVAERLKSSGNASAAVKALVDADIQQETKMTYPGPFWISRRDTGQYVIVNGGNYGYTASKDGATEFAKHETASKNFDKLDLSTDTHCIVPSRDID